VRTIVAAVSFFATPTLEISKATRTILDLGWTEGEKLPEGWVVTFSKDVPEGVDDPEAELREAMGSYWIDATELGQLLKEMKGAS